MLHSMYYYKIIGPRRTKNRVQLAILQEKFKKIYKNIRIAIFNLKPNARKPIHFIE